MPTYFLPVFRKNATLELAERVGAVQGGTVTLGATLAFCQWYRIRGICALFLEGRADSFLADLHRSGRAFLHYLGNAPVAQKVTSRAAPFFDAIASGELACARDIARNSRLTWNAEEEFEDDFHYVLFLMKHFFLDGTAEECAAVLKRFAEILDGAPDPHFVICQAFAAGDAQQFGDGLAELLQNYESRYQKRLAADAVAFEEAATEPKLCVEGLALVKLAEMKQFPLEDDYLLIPSTAREKATVVFGADDWKTP
jgi:hypothetical protein